MGNLLGKQEPPPTTRTRTPPATNATSSYYSSSSRPSGPTPGYQYPGYTPSSQSTLRPTTTRAPEPTPSYQYSMSSSSQSTLRAAPRPEQPSVRLDAPANRIVNQTSYSNLNSYRPRPQPTPQVTAQLQPTTCPCGVCETARPQIPPRVTALPPPQIPQRVQAPRRVETPPTPQIPVRALSALSVSQRNNQFLSDESSTQRVTDYYARPATNNYSLPTQAEVENDEEPDELEKNVFSQFYTGEKTEKPKKETRKTGWKTKVHPELKSYKHADAVKFAQASWSWRKNRAGDCAPQPRNRIYDLKRPPSQTGTRAYYRVIAKWNHSHVLLMACHVNVHGLHREDLQFVQVNDRTITEGLEGNSPVVNLYYGDIVAVTELVRNTMQPLKVSEGLRTLTYQEDEEFFWSVRRMVVLERKINKFVKFALLSNGNAVVRGGSELMSLDSVCWRKTRMYQEQYSKKGVDTGECDVVPTDECSLHTGEAFIPRSTPCNFTEDYDESQKNELVLKASDIFTYPNALGTIYKMEDASEESMMFSIGYDAFNLNTFIPPSFTREKIVETCVLMGYSAAKSIFDGRFDCRVFPIYAPRKKETIFVFSIDNPLEQPTEGRWSLNHRLQFSGDEDFTGIIESATLKKGKLFITARLAKDSPNFIDFTKTIIVSQREPMECKKLNDGFFINLKPGSNGRRIIETLYGGAKIEESSGVQRKDFYFNNVTLNRFQAEYVSMILAGLPLVLGSSPFGCGKSMTIVVTAMEVHKRDLTKKRSQQLLLTQSNYASVNLIDIVKKMNGSNVKFVRYVSEKNVKELPEHCRTSWDVPELMAKTFVKWAVGDFEGTVVGTRLQATHWKNMTSYILDNKLLPHSKFQGKARSIYDKKQMIRPWCETLLDAFFILYQPDVIITTIDSLQKLTTSGVLNNVSVIQIDESSQVPEYSLISILSSFPEACFGLFGDIQQLPPYCEQKLTGKLKEYGVGGTMRRALKKGMFPTAVLRYVYRCHPVTTQILSNLFYPEGMDLIPGVREHQRNEFMRMRTDFWPNRDFPIIVINNESAGEQIGTSQSNTCEAILVRQIVESALEKIIGYNLDPEDIGVISFYTAQTSVLSHRLASLKGVKVGTVDSFQGTEREVIVLCCTNSYISEFMQFSNRLNVAMSRARQATIIIGNLDGDNGLRESMYWRKIVEQAEEKGCVADARNYLKGGYATEYEREFNGSVRQGSRGGRGNRRGRRLH